MRSTFVFPGIEVNFTNGVFPIACNNVSNIFSLYNFLQPERSTVL